MRVLKYLIYLGIAGFVAVFLLVIGAAFYFSSKGIDDISRGQGDVIIVLSAGVDRDAVELDPFSKARVATGVQLWRKGAARWLLMSGGLDPTTGQHVAEEMKLHAISLGAPESVILVEGNSISTFENARFTLDVARQERWRKAIVVTDDFHLLRAYTLFQFWRQEGDVEIVALAAADGRSQAGILRASWILVRETLAIPFNVMKMTGQVALEAMGGGEKGVIR